MSLQSDLSKRDGSPRWNTIFRKYSDFLLFSYLVYQQWARLKKNKDLSLNLGITFRSRTLPAAAPFPFPTVLFLLPCAPGLLSLLCLCWSSRPRVPSPSWGRFSGCISSATSPLNLLHLPPVRPPTPPPWKVPSPVGLSASVCIGHRWCRGLPFPDGEGGSQLLGRRLPGCSLGSVPRTGRDSKGLAKDVSITRTISMQRNILEQ